MTPNAPHESSGPSYSTLPEDTEARLPARTLVAGGRIEIVGEMARGGMAIVYKARDLQRDGAFVAFKVVTGHENGADTAQRYKNDARLAASLAGDPRFVPPLGVGCLDGPPGFEGRMFLITELIEAPSLDKVMSDFSRGMPIDRAVAIASAVARALVSLHERGIVHRDIKPGNILLDEGGSVRLIDFGLAYATGDGWEAKSPDLTQEGHAPGTPVYMSPQQIVHERPTPAFDVYAFGATCYELISGQPPYDGMALQVLISRKCDPLRQPFSIGKMCQHTPKHVAELVDRCLSYDPAKRPTASEIVEALSPERAEERAEPTPELRLVPQVPSVVAEGSRPAGDVTRADLVRKDVPLPFVKRTEAAREQDPAGEWASSDEVQIIPKAEIIAAVAASSPFAAPLKDPIRTQDRVEAQQEARPEPRRGKRRLLIAAVLAAALLAVALSWLLLPATTEPPRVGAGATVEQQAVEHDSGAPMGAPPRDVGSDADPSLRAVEEERLQPATPPRERQDSAGLDPPHRSATKDNDSSPRQASKRKQGRKKSAAAPTCDQQRAAARTARSNRQWRSVLSSTSQAACWSGSVEDRERLRVEALLRLGRYKACVLEASRSSDPQVLRWRDACFDRRAEKNAAGGSENP